MRQFFRNQASQQRTIHANQVRHVARQHLFEDRSHARMVSPQRENSPAGEEIQVTAALRIEQPFALTADIVLIETDGPDHLHECRIQVVLV